METGSGVSHGHLEGLRIPVSSLQRPEKKRDVLSHCSALSTTWPVHYYCTDVPHDALQCSRPDTNSSAVRTAWCSFHLCGSHCKSIQWSPLGKGERYEKCKVRRSWWYYLLTLYIYKYMRARKKIWKFSGESRKESECISPLLYNCRSELLKADISSMLPSTMSENSPDPYKNSAFHHHCITRLNLAQLYCTRSFIPARILKTYLEYKMKARRNIVWAAKKKKRKKKKRVRDSRWRICACTTDTTRVTATMQTVRVELEQQRNPPQVIVTPKPLESARRNQLDINTMMISEYLPEATRFSWVRYSCKTTFM